MCGIVGYIGGRNATEILLDGLKKLEYRGYDSSGVALLQKSEITVCKEKGRLDALKEKIAAVPTQSGVGIGHTRWATHGEPSGRNSHPHLSGSGRIAVVHNGIIENFASLKKELISDGFIFKSETDTEVIPHLIEKYFEGNLEKAVRAAAVRLEGSFAICVISADDGGKIVAARCGSPLVCGLSKGEQFVASDVGALASYTSEFYILDDGEAATITSDGITVWDFDGNALEKETFKADDLEGEAEKGSFPHFMLKEIYEQPASLKKTLCSKKDDDKIKDFFRKVDKIHIVACGTAYHAGLVGKWAIEKAAAIPCEVHFASEFRYGEPLFSDKTGVILISQSGETADTLAALRQSRERGALTLAVTNVRQSSISRECDVLFYTEAGAEIAVASTKAYTTQLAAMYLLALAAGEVTDYSADEWRSEILREIEKIPALMSAVLEMEEEISLIAKEIYNEKNIYFIGRGLDMFVSLEGALKMKEITYIHSDTYGGGEIKHGPIALIDKGSVVISTVTNEKIAPKSISNIKETLARGARAVGILTENCKEYKDVFDRAVVLPSCPPLLSPLLSVIPLQLLSYHVAILKGCDVDKPRNLAKSVTVE